MNQTTGGTKMANEQKTEDGSQKTEASAVLVTGQATFNAVYRNPQEWFVLDKDAKNRWAVSEEIILQTTVGVLLNEYHAALNRREHGGVAADKLIQALQKRLNLYRRIPAVVE
jgi:hypothetical protein